ncbi:MAG: hypothetical protein DMF00_07590 [Verrucomicrobia bacterium]|nr:MAG: hypothetical protein DMF00_07590 [Verrucomicrobiota bacterium]
MDEKAAANNAESLATRGRSASKSNGERDSMLGRRELTFLLIRFVSSVQPWLLFCRERFESLSANAFFRRHIFGELKIYRTSTLTIHDGAAVWM